MDFKKMTKKELYEIAKKFNVKNRSKMTKAELVKALKEYEEVVSPVVAPVDEAVSSPMPKDKTEEKEYPKQPEYPIPEKYDIDTVVLLPVNPKKEYVYWEISDRTVDDFCKKMGLSSPAFILKVFAGEGDNVSELASVKVSKYGNWYFDLYCPDQNLWAEIGILDNMGNYYPVVNSKKIKMPDDSVCAEMDKETWMTVGEKIEDIYQLSGITDIQKEELISSARMHSELFKKLHNVENISSFSMHKKDETGGEK
jgi:hypothetical protein